jgi:hypothetical protein
MSFLSVLVLFLALISLTNIAGNPKQQIHAQPNGLIYNQPPTIEPHTSGPGNQRSLAQKFTRAGTPPPDDPKVPPITPPKSQLPPS